MPKLESFHIVLIVAAICLTVAHVAEQIWK